MLRDADLSAPIVCGNWLQASSVPEPPELTVPEGFGSCVITDEQPCSLEYLRENQGDRAGWVIFPPNTVCVDGSNYAFQVRPRCSPHEMQRHSCKLIVN